MGELSLSVLAAAYGADLLIGDPRWLPHPVRVMGLAIQGGEWLLRKLVTADRQRVRHSAAALTAAAAWERLAGAFLVLVVVGGSYGLSAWLLKQLAAFSPAWGLAGSVFLLFTCFSTRDLAVESRAVWRALDAADLPRARRAVSRIVGRDTERLDQAEIVRATLETIAESTLDGILSPLFYVVLGGVPLAVAYKAINTLDSMVGHRSARYIRFGWAAANVDTWANWLPARWSAIVFAAATWLRHGWHRASESWQYAWRDGSGGPVPNAGIPEAALAGALEVRLGGVNWYQGQPVQMPVMGDARKPLESPRIPEAIRLMYAASVIAWLMATSILACERIPAVRGSWGSPASAPSIHRVPLGGVNAM